ncbi:MarR family winged helix-turn-helix transcriptional regulator [Halarcobacter anaerophilus]|uniref:MarR family winged helix-turn-helix transcriptional regulator n=1 Tax=Halarcobacter anaerophilus TaxID=877500 RepID=UPI0005CB3FE7|nr:MarR family transcriptional regulator [Halarcobacter anaerophilus]
MDKKRDEDKACLGFLIARVHSKLRQRLNQKLRKYEITIEQRQIILKLFTYGAMSQRELCEKTLTEPSNLTMTLKRMEQKGYIRKIKHPKDKRALLIEATPKAFELKKELAQVGQNNIEQLLEGVEQEKIDTTFEVLQEIYKKALEEDINNSLKIEALI